MRPSQVSYTLVALDADGYLNDATGVGPWTTILAQPGDGCSHPVTLASTANLSAITFTITGTDAEGRSQSITQAGPNNNTVTTTTYFATVTSISASSTVGANTFDAGWTAAAYTPLFPTDFGASSGPLVTAGISGTITLTAQQTNSDVFNSGITPLWVTLGSAGATATAMSLANAGVTGVRVSVASHTSGILTVAVSQCK